MSPYPTDPLPPPNNIDTQADQAAQLTEPTFDHDMPDEAALLHREFGPPDPDGVYGRNVLGGPPEVGMADPSGAGIRTSAADATTLTDVDAAKDEDGDAS